MEFLPNKQVQIFKGNCFDILPSIPDNSIDLILADLPYGKTRNKWDSILPLNKLWQEYNRIKNKNCAVILFGQDKFTALLMMSNWKNHRYNLIWKKGSRSSGFLNAKRMPLRNHEDICIFYDSLPTYNPQFSEGVPLHGKGSLWKTKEGINNNYGYFRSDDSRKGMTQKYPKSVLDFDRPHPPRHPTEKPVSLLEYLIRTYSNPDDLVLDNTMGIGSTGVAAVKSGRRFIGIELLEKYYVIAKERIDGELSHV